jgi:UDP-glucose 6-dehydrogenase
MDPRIGSRAYVRPGLPIEGGTLLRDVRYLGNRLASVTERPIMENSVIEKIWSSNNFYKDLIISRVVQALSSGGNRIAIAGVSYKTGSSALRQSLALELAESLKERGYAVSLFDPNVTSQELTSRGFSSYANLDELVQTETSIVWNLPFNFPENLHLSAIESPRIFVNLSGTLEKANFPESNSDVVNVW